MDEKLLYLPEPDVNVVDSYVAEMVLKEAQLNFRKNEIQQKIDQSLLDKDKSEFLRLTEELKAVSQSLEGNRNEYLNLIDKNE
jgi:uncharacterized protein YpiB (UPF0302 family)